MGLNDIIKYLFIGLAITVICSVSSAMVIDGKLTTIELGDYSYQRVLDHNEEVVYEQQGANVPVRQVIKNDVEQKNLNSVAGKDIGGYSKLILRKIDEHTVSIEGDRQEYHSDSNIPAELRYTVTGKFVKGTWSDLISNKPIKITFNPDGTPTIRAKLKGYLEKVITSLGNKKLAAMAASKSWTERVKANAVGYFTRTEVPTDKLAITMVALEGTKESLSQSFTLDTEFRLFTK